MTKSKTANKILYAGLAIAGVIGIAAAVYMFLGRDNDRNMDADAYITQALSASSSAYAERSANLKLPDASALKHNPYEFAVSARLRDYKLSALPEDFEFTAETLKLLNFTSRSRVDLQNRRLLNDISAHMGGVELFDISLYLSDDKYALGSRLLFQNDSYVYITPQTFAADWNASPFFGDAEFWNSLPLLPDLGVTGGPVSEDIDFAPYNDLFFADKTLVKPLETDIAAALFEMLEAYDAASYPDGESNRAAGEYTVINAVYGRDTLNSAFDAVSRSLTDELRRRFTDILAFTADFAGAGDTVDAALANIPASPFTEGISAVLLIDGDNLIREITVNEIRGAGDTYDYVNVRIEGAGDFGGAYGDNVIFVAEGSDGSAFRITNDAAGCAEDRLDHKLTVSVTDAAGETAEFAYSALWLPAAGNDYRLALSVDSAETRAEVLVEGQMTADDTSINIRDAEIMASFGDEFVELRADWMVSANAEPPAIDEAAARNMFDINAIEWLFIGSRLAEFLFSF